MNRYLKLAAVLLCAAAAIWCAEGPLHPQLRQAKEVFTITFAQTLVATHQAQSPLAHRLLPDFAQLSRYQQANRRLPPASAGRVIFYGDSITDFWPTTFAAQFFSGKPYIGRGTSGQSTPELVWRFQQDVLDLHPSTVIILAGTNDIINPPAQLSPHQTVSNIETMVRMAQHHGIHVILCSILPVSHFPEPRQHDFTTRIEATNAALRTFAQQQNLIYVDYFSAMADPAGALLPSLSPDGIHPNAAGYAIMQGLAQTAIDQIAVTQTTHPLPAQTLF